MPESITNYNWYLVASTNLVIAFICFLIIRLRTKRSWQTATIISLSIAVLAFFITMKNAWLFKSIIKYDLMMDNAVILNMALSCCFIVLLMFSIHNTKILERNSGSDTRLRLNGELFRLYFDRNNVLFLGFLFLFGFSGLKLPLTVTAVYTALIFLAFPLWQWMRQDVRRLLISDDENQKTDISSEREKVLAMVENGKVSADDAVLLINALESNARPQPRSEKGLLGGWRIMTIGAFLCIVAGVLLPWFWFSTHGDHHNDVTHVILKQMRETLAELHQSSSGSVFLYLAQLQSLSTILVIVLTISVPITFFGLGKWINPRVTITISAVLLLGAMITLLINTGSPILTPTFGIYTTAAGLLLMAWAIFEAWKEQQN